MSPTYYDLLAAGYKPEQILTCPSRPCLCKQGQPQKECGLAKPKREAQ